MSFFWSSISVSPIFKLDIDLFLFWPFMALIFAHTSFVSVSEFIEAKNLFQQSCLLFRIVLIDIAFAFLYSIWFSVVGLFLNFLYAFFLFLVTVLHSSFHQGFGILSLVIVILPIASSAAEFSVLTI